MSKKMVWFFVLTVVLLGFFRAGFGQDSLSNIYSGKIISEGKPVPSVTIMVEGRKKGLVSDDKGGFVLNNLNPGKIKLHFSAVGYKHHIKEVVISAGERVSDTIELFPARNTMEDVVVSGTMRAVSKMDSPIPVEVY